jgi:hypothetical protein
MDEEAGRFAVTGWPEAAPLLVTTVKIDLSRILDRQNPAPGTLNRSTRGQRLDNPVNRDVGR